MTSKELGIAVATGCFATMLLSAAPAPAPAPAGHRIPSEFDFCDEAPGHAPQLPSLLARDARVPVAPGWLFRSGGLSEALAAGDLVGGLCPEPERPAAPLVTSLERPGQVQNLRFVQQP